MEIYTYIIIIFKFNKLIYNNLYDQLCGDVLPEQENDKIEIYSFRQLL